MPEPSEEEVDDKLKATLRECIQATTFSSKHAHGSQKVTYEAYRTAEDIPAVALGLYTATSECIFQNSVFHIQRLMPVKAMRQACRWMPLPGQSTCWSSASSNGKGLQQLETIHERRLRTPGCHDDFDHDGIFSKELEETLPLLVVHEGNGEESRLPVALARG